MVSAESIISRFYLIQIITNSDHISYFLIWMGCHCVLSGLDITWVYLIHLLLVMIWFIYQFGFIWFRYHGVLTYSNITWYYQLSCPLCYSIQISLGIIWFKYHMVYSEKNITGLDYDITLYNLIDVNIIGFRYREELSDSAITWFCHM